MDYELCWLELKAAIGSDINQLDTLDPKDTLPYRTLPAYEVLGLILRKMESMELADKPLYEGN